MNIPKPSGEVVTEIALLGTLRPSFTGLSDAGARIDAQIEVLKYGLDYEAIREAYADRPEVLQDALYANDWRNGEPVEAPSLVWRASA